LDSFSEDPEFNKWNKAFIADVEAGVSEEECLGE
jgi:hypothetical protein